MCLLLQVEVLECSSMLDDAFLCGEDDDLESVSVAQESHSPDTEEKGGLCKSVYIVVDIIILLGCS